jgi:molybdopterin-synthase adenylyltransferase
MASDLWFIDDDDRYSRLRLIAWWDQRKLARARVLVIGAGALGNEVLKNLALVGVGTIHVVDCDRIEPTNLARSILYRQEDCGRPKAEVAARMLRQLNPDVTIHPWHGDVIADIGLGLFRDVDLVIACLDNREARLWVNRQCWKVSRPWIDGGIQEIDGVVKVFTPPAGACYECAMTENDYRLINLRYSCPLLRREDLLAGKVPTAPTIASVIGGLQAQEALKILHGLDTMPGEAMVFNGVSNQMYRTRFPFREDCLSHETWDAADSLPISHEHTAAELLDAAERMLGLPGGEVLLERDLVVELVCLPCGFQRDVLKTTYQVSAGDAWCPECGQPAHPRMVHRVGRDSPLSRERLSRLGVPAYDILRLQGPWGERTVLLAADRDRVLGPASRADKAASTAASSEEHLAHGMTESPVNETDDGSSAEPRRSQPRGARES